MTIKIGELVAVYGSLRAGLGNHRVLDTKWGGSEYVKTTRTADNHNLRAYCSGFPCVSLNEGEGTVVVELYRILTDETAHRLDRLEGYPSFYDRTKIEMLDGEEAWIYHINNSQAEIIEDGDWKRYYEEQRS